MKEQDLEIIKSRTLFLKEGDKSSEIILVDPCNGDMYFTFELKYIEDIVSAKTKLSIKDEHHAELVKDVRNEYILQVTGKVLAKDVPNPKPITL